ncbi:MAG: PASTA domain-containing protein [Desulfobacterales bacterium]|nr:PASTA domain-containing protein [Desulfobacterales bacterium]
MIAKITKIAGLGLAFILVAGISAYLTLALIIKSEDTVIVPSLEGKDVVYALELLTELELNTKVKGSEYTADIPKNYVVFQEPQPGAEIKKGRDVKIILSKGPKTVSMPNLFDLSVQQANIILEEYGICQGELSRTYNKKVEKDHIIAQVPSQGTMISRGGCVDLLISMGVQSKAFKMPDLIGLTLEDALQSIEKVKLVIGEIKSSHHKNKPRNIIVKQAPTSGHRVIAASPVSLLINRESKKERPDRPYGQYTASLFSYRLDNGFLKRRIRVSLNSAGFTNDLFDDYVKAGEEIWLLIPRDSEATLFLYENDKLIKTQTYDAY